MLLDNERYAEVIAYGKDAVTKMGENKRWMECYLYRSQIREFYQWKT